jgi:hypothetical protein
VRSLCSSIPLSLTTITPHPTGLHKHPCKPLQWPTNTERAALKFRFGRGKPPPPCDLFVPASYQHHHPSPLTPQVPTITHAGFFNPRPILCVALGFLFGRAKPPPPLDLTFSVPHHLNHLSYVASHVLRTTPAKYQPPPTVIECDTLNIRFGVKTPCPLILGSFLLLVYLLFWL